MRPIAAAVFLLLSTLPVFAQQATLDAYSNGHAYLELAAGEPTVFEAGVTNHGRETATNVRLVIDVPAEVQLEQVSGAPDCDLTMRPVRCSIGDIGPNDFRYLYVYARGPAAEGAFTLVATFEADNAPRSNALTHTFVYRVQTMFAAQISGAGRIDPGIPLQFVTRIITFPTNSPPPPNVRIGYAVSGANITSIDAYPNWSCTISGGAAECVSPTISVACDACNTLTVHVSEPPDGGIVSLAMNVSSDLPEATPQDNTALSRIEVYRHFVVNTTADAGEGSLRNAIELANQVCGDAPCKIVFNIPPPIPAEGWLTIIPSTPLPPVTATRMVIDGNTQTAFGGDTNPRGPEIALDGRAAGSGLEMHSGCEGVVRGLAIGNFMENQGLWYENPARDCGAYPYLDQRTVESNYIGTDPTGTVAWPNLRGLRADFATNARISDNVISGNRYSGVWMWVGRTAFTRNRIGTTADGTSPLPNGASGIFLGLEAVADVIENTIAFHPQMGLAIARGAQRIYAAHNSMRDNGGLGIDWGLDGVSPVNDDDRDGPTNAPVLLDARYDEASQMTIVTMTWRTQSLFVGGNSFNLHFFANRAPDGDGEQPLFDGSAVRIDGTPFEAIVPGDHRGKWLNATGTRFQYFGFARPPRTRSESAYPADTYRTSELSNAVLVH